MFEASYKKLSFRVERIFCFSLRCTQISRGSNLLDSILCCSTPFPLHSMELVSLLNTNDSDTDTLLLSWVVSKVITSSVVDVLIVLMSGIQFLKKNINVSF